MKKTRLRQTEDAAELENRQRALLLLLLLRYRFFFSRTRVAGSREPWRNLTRDGGSVKFVGHAVLDFDPTLPGNDVTNVFGALGNRARPAC
jgi:hypothetical protein